MPTRIVLAFVFLAAGMLVVSGCGQQGSPSPVASQPEAGAPDAPQEFDATPEMAAILAKADALDGQTDKIVSRCASCALGMDGSKEHSLHVGEYTMYFCADDCKKAFSEDIAKSVLDLKVPAAEGSNVPQAGSRLLGLPYMALRDSRRSSRGPLAVIPAKAGIQLGHCESGNGNRSAAIDLP